MKAFGFHDAGTAVFQSASETEKIGYSIRYAFFLTVNEKGENAFFDHKNVSIPQIRFIVRKATLLYYIKNSKDSIH